MIFDGQAKNADKKLEEAIKNAPDPLVGEGPYTKLKSLAQKITTHKDLGSVLNTIKTKHLNSEDKEEKAEAEKLAGRLIKYGEKLLKKAELKKDKEPIESYNLYNEIATLFKGDEIGDKAKAVVDELKKDKTFQDNMKADKELSEIKAEIEKFKHCPKCSSFNKDCENCQKKNSNYNAVVQRAKSLVKKYPSSPAATNVKELLPLDDK